MPFVATGCAGGSGFEVEGCGAKVAEECAGAFIGDAAGELEADGGIEGGLDGGAVGEGERGIEEAVGGTGAGPLAYP